MSLFVRALAFASERHGDAGRKGGDGLAILHAAEAACIASTMTSDERVLAAAVLHDTVEDAGVSPEEIKELFGDRVAFLVAAETEDKQRRLPASETWKMRKQASIELLRRSDDRDVGIVFLSDKLSNMRAFYRQKNRLGDGLWQLFNQRDPEQHHWYYRSIADALPELRDTEAWKEYDWLISRVFEEGGRY